MAGDDDNPLLVSCAGCGTPFEATPDSFLEVGFVAEEGDADDDEDEDCISKEDLAAMSEIDLRAFGLDASARDAILAAKPGDDVQTGAEPFCARCYAQMFPDED